MSTPTTEVEGNSSNSRPQPEEPPHTGEGPGSNSSPQPEQPLQEGSLCPMCLQEMVRDLCCNQPQCGHVYHWACVEGKGVLQCPCCEAAPFNPRGLFFELGCSQAAVAGEGAGGAEVELQPYKVEMIQATVATPTKVVNLNQSGEYYRRYEHYGQESGKKKIDSIEKKYRVRFPTGNVFEGTYTDHDDKQGPLADPIKNGTGKMTYSKGGSYDGEWKDGLPHGHGTKVYTNGDVYTGNFNKVC
eukprot:GHVU01115412.1.p1 GENE.GHVU01115412.1~~GHVU01115412.1.p1  ORF type:complete len:243 (+),score=43.25 GHVU01115412.1:142-870(+)